MFVETGHIERLVGFDRGVWEFVKHIGEGVPLTGSALGETWITREILEEALKAASSPILSIEYDKHGAPFAKITDPKA